MAQPIQQNVPGGCLTRTSLHTSSGVGCGRETSLCLTHRKVVHWLKLSRGSAKETRCSYGIDGAGSTQTGRKAYASGSQAVELAESVREPYP